MHSVIDNLVRQGQIEHAPAKKEANDTHPNLLVRLLPIPARLHDRHDDVLRRHKRQLLRDPTRDDAGVHDQALGHVLQRREHDVRRQERLGQRDAPVCAIVQRPLEPLHARRLQRVLLQRHQVPRERADPLGPHGVALVRHRGRPDLRRLERLLDLLQVREQAEVRRELVGRCAKRGERGEHVDVDLARVSLRGDRVCVGKPRKCGDSAVQLLDLPERM